VEVLVSAASRDREGATYLLERCRSGDAEVSTSVQRQDGADHIERPLGSWDEDILRPRAPHVRAAYLS
jgi:hypothetical protein